MNETKVLSPVKQDTDIHSALKDIRTSLQKTKINNPDSSPCNVYGNNNCNNDYYDRVVAPEKVDSPTVSLSPVWIPRQSNAIELFGSLLNSPFSFQIARQKRIVADTLGNGAVDKQT